MKHRRRFSIELKRQVVEELLSGVSTPAQLMRRHEISSGLLYHWKEQYARGRFDNEPSMEAALEDRVRQLEQGRQAYPGERVFKKSRSEGALVSAEEKRRFIAEHRHLLESTERGCRLMNLPRSTYYHKPKNESGNNPHLINCIEAIIEEFSGYGYRRVTRELHRQGDPSNPRRCCASCASED